MPDAMGCMSTDTADSLLLQPHELYIALPLPLTISWQSKLNDGCEDLKEQPKQSGI